MPKVSVLMGLYNQDRFVAESICAVLQQTMPDLELIIVDDGSTDNSYDMAKTYADLDERVRLYQNRENLGQAKTFNIAASFACGEYMGWHSSDDRYVPDALELLLEPQADVAYGGHIENNNEIINAYDYERLKHKCYIFAGAMIYKREVYDAIGGYDESFRVAPDWDFTLRACAGRHVAAIPQVVSHYRQLHIQSNRLRTDEALRREDRERIRAGNYGV